MYNLVITEGYFRKSKRFFSKHKDILGQYEKILTLLCCNPQHPLLRLHKLSGKLSGLHSVSITLSYRLIIQFIIKNHQIIPVDIGAHDDVY